jgi:hypothetical protein
VSLALNHFIRFAQPFRWGGVGLAGMFVCAFGKVLRFRLGLLQQIKALFFFQLSEKIAHRSAASAVSSSQQSAVHSGLVDDPSAFFASFRVACQPQ